MLSLAWRIARRELRGGVRGFRVFLLCLATGVATIAAIGSLSSALTEGIRADGRKILGGDIDVRLSHRPASAAQLDWMKARGRVSTVANMRSLARTETAHTLVEIKAVDDVYPLFGQLRLAGDTPLPQVFAKQDGRWGAAVDETLLIKLDLGVGESIRIGDIMIRVAAVIEREPDRATGAFTIGQRVLIGFDALADTGLVQPGSLIRYHYRIGIPDRGAVVEWRNALETAFPKAGWRIRDTRNAAPGIRRVVDRIAVFMTVVGLTALLVGGVGVGNAVRAFLQSRISTIATLKCLGASSRMIFAIYMMQVLVLAAAGIAMGAVFGALAPLAAGPIFGDQLPIELHVGVYPKPLLLSVLFGFLVTLVFSLLPLARARRVPAANLFRYMVAPVRAAGAWRDALAFSVLALLLGGVVVATADDQRLASYFVAGAAGTLAVFRIAAAGIAVLARRAPYLRSTHLRFALGNLHRPGAPTGIVATSLGLGLTVLVAVALIEGNLSEQVGRGLPEDAPGTFFIDIQPHQTDGFDRIVRGIPGVRNLRRVPMLRGRIVEIGGKPVGDMTVPPEYAWVLRGDRGLTWSRTPPKSGSKVVEGVWWPTDYSGPPLLSFDEGAARALGISIGDMIKLNVLGREFDAKVANLRRIEWNSFAINFVMILAPGVLDGAPQAHIATARADDPAIEVALERAVADQFSNISAIRVREVLTRLEEIVGHLATAVRAVGMVVIFAGILVLAGAIAASHKQRVYDAVVLKVFGATRRDVLAIFSIEFALLGFATSAIASVIGTAASWAVVTRLMRAEWEFLPMSAATTIAACLVATVFIGALGTWSAMGRKAAPLLRNE
ncbi:MAG: FtsX-like permease family protein [Alphaproteobacteria bacterium]|nr:FtsX-like permease family protein [Alphaproteobacteria bacterium]